MRRIGILGGTFDPPHFGHLAAVVAARDVLGLDEVQLVVANEPWQKTPLRPVTPALDRLALTEAAAEGLERVTVSSREIDRGGPSYTVDTVREVRDEAEATGAPVEVVLIVGADLVGDLPGWERADELAPLVTLAVVSRPGCSAEAPPPWHAVVVEGPAVEVSSSEIRERLVAGQSVEGLVPPAVIRCIERRGLYAGGR